MDIGIFAKTFPGLGAQSVLGAARAAGYRTTQFNLACLGGSSMPDALAPAVAQEIAAASRSTGAAIAAVSGTYNMAHPDEAVRSAGLARLDVLIRHAHAMGTRLVTLCTGSRDAKDQWRHHPDNDSPEAWRVMLTEMERAVAIAEQHDVDLGIEPELANVVSSAQHARRLIDSIRSPSIKIVLDPANLFEVAGSAQRRAVVAEAVDLLGDRVAMAHAKDRLANGEFAAAGTGVIDFHHFVGCLRAIEFDGPLVTHGLAAAEAPSVCEFLTRTLAETIG